MVQKEKPTVETTVRRRGPPRAYDADIAVGNALDLFRRSGYAATSLDDLSAATGMNRPSLYGAFGDKRALYIKSYQRYRDDYTAKVIELFKADIDIRERLRRFYAAALDIYTSDDTDACGCFAVMTVASDAITDPEIRALMIEGFKELEEAFAWCFRTAIARGELPETADVGTLAAMASALLNLLSIRARAGVPRAELETIVAGAIEQLSRA